MLTEERFQAILSLLNEKQAVTVTELTHHLGASESTIRRDLTTLHRQGRLLKVHGGATALSSYLSHDNDMQTKHDLNLEEKRAIAAHAAGMIENGDVVFLDAGSTTGLIANYLTATDVTFVTNGLGHARALTRIGCRVVQLGGEVKPITEAVVGNVAIDMLRHFNFTKGFFGVNGISLKAGYTTPEINEAAVKTEAMHRCRSSYILADSAKFDTTATLTFAPLTDAVILTTVGPHTYSIYANETTIIEVKKL
ncbi:MAG: DeoR/GlpR family DNA-binding transcription regulator [Eubacteriales bacterium]|nr:DeoR/GlpR family DNA-binding transcription regulator [Eubacteriales bacterium]